MSGENLFGTDAEQAAITAEIDERTEGTFEETTEDELPALVLASIMFCAGLIAASIGLNC